ncbi:uncharacterized protein STEHIDRAFT_167215 [Stereum hirsutum FP-91666 SS1]|uniref:uncharacterized protein n=1 Tax=Stereum hirsutum (strain FP-91666) TaxID=721885 RepID=UPI000440C725|nr:uncharacterized protein STEHIDRAFT_167215 [Stereum hirsutum FP-91666 SS1]EIM87744.1 hypothetical protein STEHIDRAFT_167215 [Stereum hirsutum FP-91666 SS1]
MPTPLSRSRIVLLSLASLLLLTFLAFVFVDYNAFLSHRRHSSPHDDLTFFIPWDAIPPVAMHIQTSVHYALDTPLGIAEWKALIPPTGHLIHLPSPDPPASSHIILDDQKGVEGNGGEVEVEVEYEEYTPTLLHQLKCLDILRESYVLSRSMRNSSPYTTSSYLNLTSPPHTPMDWSSPPSTSSSHSSPASSDAEADGRYPTSYSGLTRHCLAYLHQSILCSANTGLESSAADDGAPRERFEKGCRDWGVVYGEVERNWGVWRGIVGEEEGGEREREE